MKKKILIFAWLCILKCHVTITSRKDGNEENFFINSLFTYCLMILCFSCDNLKDLKYVLNAISTSVIMRRKFNDCGRLKIKTNIDSILKLFSLLRDDTHVVYV